MQIEVLRLIRIEADLRDQLEQLPPKLAQLYEQLYQTLTTEPGTRSRSIIDNVFKWLLCAQRQFTSAELIIAVAMNLPISPSAITKETILHLCRNFVVFDKGSDVFRFAHLSVKEFLEKRPDFCRLITHAFAAEACLVSVLIDSGCDEAKQYLTRDCNVKTEGKLQLPHNRNRDSFYRYAREVWYWHFREAEENAVIGSLKKISSFFLFPNLRHKSPLQTWLKWFVGAEPLFILKGRNIRLDDIIDGQSNPIAKTIFLACALDLGEIVRSYLKDLTMSDEMKNQCLDIAMDYLEDGEGNGIVLKLLLTESSNLRFSDEMLSKVVRRCAKGEISINLLAPLLDLFPARTVTEDLLSGAIDRWCDKDTSAKLMEILLDRAGEFLITQKLLDLAANTLHFSVVELLLSRPRSARVTEKTLRNALANMPNPIIGRLLDQTETHAITPSVLTAAVRRGTDKSNVEKILHRTIVTEQVVNAAAENGSVQMMALILEHGGAKHVSSETIGAAVCSGNVELVTMLLDRGGDVTQDLVQMASKHWRTEVFTLLLDRVGMVTQPTFEKAASGCNLEVFTLMLERGGTITDAVLQATLKNWRYGARIIEMLLDRDPMFLTVKGIPQFLERAVSSMCMGPDDGIHLAERLLAMMPDQEISATTIRSIIIENNHSQHILDLLLGETRRLRITESVLVAALKVGHVLQGLPSDVCIALFERAENITIGNLTRMLEAAAATRHSKEILEHLLSRWHDVRITEAVFEAAAGNSLSGKEALLLLEAHSGRIINTQTVAKAAISRGSPKTARLLLVQPRDWTVTKELVICATWNKCTGKEMVTLLVKEFAGTITQSLIFEAARDKRCQEAGLKALLGPTKIDNVPEDLLLTILDHRSSFPYGNHAGHIEVLLRGCCSVEITDSVFEAIAVYSPPAGPYTSSGLLRLFLERSKLPRRNERMVKAAIHSPDAVGLFEILLMERKDEIRIGKEAVASATHNGNSELLQFFAASGLWTQPIDEWIDTAIRMKKKMKKLEHAAEWGDQADVWDLVLAGVAADQPDDNGCTPLMFAAMYGHESVVSILLEFGAQPDQKDHWESTPLHVAAKSGHWKVVETLLKSGQVSMDPDFLDETPLSMAVEREYLGVVRLLDDYIEQQRMNSEQ